jgi:L,D-transpeptidase catalytic domain
MKSGRSVRVQAVVAGVSPALFKNAAGSPRGESVRSADTAAATELARFVRLLAGMAIAIFVCSCEELPPAVQKPLAAILPMPTPSGYWNGEDVHGSPKIVVHLSEQKADFYKGKHLVGESTISTGKKGFSTPPGSYTVLEKDKNHVSSEFGDYVDDEGNVVKSNIDVRKDTQPRGSHFDGARMPYFMRFRGGYGMHAGYVPPYRASHGCIRLPGRWAKPFFDNAEEGTPVIVKE